MATQSVVLASSSPRRRELLEMLGYDVEVRRPRVDETRVPGENVETMLERLARRKAEAVGESPHPIVAADTVVVFDWEIIGKPIDADDAATILRRLSGRTHRVLTGFAVRTGEGVHVEVVSTSVTMRELTRETIARYVASGDPLDKAGAYGIQSRAAPLIREIAGSFTNVVGLPLDEVVAALARFRSY